MPEKAASTLVVELTASTDDTRFLVTNRIEIVRILRGLAQRNEMVSAFFNAGNDLLLTSVLDIYPEKNVVVLDCGANEALNQRILNAEKIIFVTALDRVKVQFVSHRIEPATYERKSAFLIPLPEQVLRLQRREYYRLTTPIVNPIKCEVPLQEGRTQEFPVVDIGAGGIGMIIGNPPDDQLEVGSIYPGCKINLPGIGMLELTLRIQSLFEVTLKNGNKTFRSGCQFINLRPATQSLIQRYIIKLERERIANSPR